MNHNELFLQFGVKSYIRKTNVWKSNTFTTDKLLQYNAPYVISSMVNLPLLYTSQLQPVMSAPTDPYWCCCPKLARTQLKAVVSVAIIHEATSYTRLETPHKQVSNVRLLNSSDDGGNNSISIHFVNEFFTFFMTRTNETQKDQSC